MEKTLYELASEYQALAHVLDEQEGELTDELEKAWDAINEELPIKMENIGHVLKNLDAEREVLEAKAKTFKSEFERLKSRAAARQSRIDWLKSYAAKNLQAADIQKLKSETFSWWTQESHSVEEVDASKVDPQYKRVEYKEFVDKKAILEDWKALPDEVRDEQRNFKGAKVVTRLGLRFR